MNLQEQLQNLQNTFLQDSLKSLRSYTHTHFDKLWKEGGFTRRQAYEWLADSMDLPSEKAHIALFDREQCLQTIAEVKATLNNCDATLGDTY